jgi:hypothetical protein
VRGPTHKSSASAAAGAGAAAVIPIHELNLNGSSDARLESTIGVTTLL